MTEPVYYNEYEPYAAAWLRNLITAGHIADGVVDTRSILDVRPSDLAGFKQCHFFAGIGVWSYALRAAGWPDDRPVWTGSCPCQPFSAAGEGLGFNDERHLWPHFGYLIKERRPAVVLGEQVASKSVDAWIDLVHADLEAMGYAFGSVPFPSAGVGAPHIRDRNYWCAQIVADPKSERHARLGRGAAVEGERGIIQRSGISGVANADSGVGRQGRAHVRGRIDGSDAQSRARLGGGGVPDGLEHARLNHDASEGQTACARQSQTDRPADIAGRSGISSCGLAHANGGDAGAEREQRGGQQRQQPQDGGAVRLADAERSRVCGQPGSEHSAQAGSGDRKHLHDSVSGGDTVRPGPTNGFWLAADWLGCRDGKWRPVEPGTFPLAHGAASRVGRLRAYGNAINAEQARIWIETVMECQP